MACYIMCLLALTQGNPRVPKGCPCEVFLRTGRRSNKFYWNLLNESKPKKGERMVVCNILFCFISPLYFPLMKACEVVPAGE